MEDGRHKRICGSGRVSVVRALAAMCAAATLIGCVSTATKKQPPVDYAHRIQRLQKQLKKKDLLIEDLKERNLVLEHRGAAPASIPAAAARPVEPAPVKEIKEVVEKAPEIPKGENGEHYLYSKIIDTYRSHNADEMKTTLRLLLKTYPDSIFADNALYMSGLQAFEMNDLAAARSAFERLLKEYPRSNKTASTLFLKAEIDKRSGRASDAVRGFKMVRDFFPGSPESFRVSVELKLLQAQATSKRRES